MRMRWSAVVSLGLALACAAALPAETYRYTGEIHFDVSKAPFSRYGSYLTIAQFLPGGITNNAPGLYVRSMRGGDHNVFRIELLAAGVTVPFTIDAEPAKLTLRAEAGSVEFCIPRADEMRVRGQGVALRLTAVTKTLTTANGNGRWEINTPPNEKFMVLPIAGELQMDAPWNGKGTARTVATLEPAADGRFGAELDTYPSVWTMHAASGSFDGDVAAVRREYAQWLARMPEVPQEFGAGAELAAYIDWASVVAPGGYLKFPAMLMSKNWMDQVWSWDHCFNAMALAEKDPELAWEQFELPFANQDAHGALPDTMGNDALGFSYTKPPIHGWAMAWMAERGGYRDVKHLATIYGPMTRWTEWFFKYRDTNGDGLPEYDHGNDSGWDNSTVMLEGSPVESPDLDAFLILQMDELARIAHALGKDAEAHAWTARADALQAKMLAKFWKGDHFVAYRADGKEIDARSLQLYLPILLGKRLPAEVRAKLIAGLMKAGRFRTANGFATEPLDSAYYQADGYWRGPIWAPTEMIVAEGLDASGEHELAKKTREDFCKMAQLSGMSENYDAVTGAPLRDPGYTWASSVYLIFAHQLWEGERTHRSKSY
jgi:hypothetical protein